MGDKLKKYESNISNLENLDSKIDFLIKDIESKYTLSKNTLKKLIEFKKSKQVSDISLESFDYREALINEIKKLNNSGEIQNSFKELFKEDELKTLAEKIIVINKLKKETQDDILKLRVDLNKGVYDDILSTKGFLIPWNNNILQKINNPKGFIDQTLGLSIGLIESGAFIGKFSYEVIISILKSPIDLINLFKKDVKYETNIKL
ncbi:hypothetical protein H3C61_02090 [Candidatus Gracilibacteria bacterium]|nr:hypothetical protein [Candidatus Gracilibacteria bacterium]